MVSGPLLVTERTLLAMAKRGATFSRKANSFIEQEWDTKKGKPKESCTTIDDVLYFVRQSMYKYGNKNINEKSCDDEENGDADTDKEDESG